MPNAFTMIAVLPNLINMLVIFTASFFSFILIPFSLYHNYPIKQDTKRKLLLFFSECFQKVFQQGSNLLPNLFPIVNHGRQNGPFFFPGSFNAKDNTVR